jgi:hypothetical protein
MQLAAVTAAAAVVWYMFDVQRCGAVKLLLAEVELFSVAVSAEQSAGLWVIVCSILH